MDSDASSNASDLGPGIEVVYPVGEETEVPQTDAQLFKTVTREGEGVPPPKGAKVTVHYTGTLESDGSKFDSSRDRDDPFEFTIGQGQVIKGWDKGVATMKPGERAVLKCLAPYAYGAAGSPPKIPGGATLNFDVELISWTKSEDVSRRKDRSVMKSIRAEGSGWTHPAYESAVSVAVKMVVAPKDVNEQADGAELVAETTVEFTMGEGPDGFPDAIEAALESMKKGEVAAVDAKAAAVTEDYPALQIKAGAPFRAIVTLKDFTTVNTYDYAGAAKVEQAAKRKEAGNAFFKEGRWARAVRKYERALEFIESDFGLEGDVLAEAKKLRTPCYTNAAQALINQKQYAAAIAKCDKCLEADPANIKALFRRGKARNASGDWEAAKPDLKRALELEPGNADVQRELAAVQEQERRQLKADKARYGGLFAKLAKMEEDEDKKAKPAEAKAAASDDAATA
uniref:peptidylprolyl isomerase n=1 Tax=Neobodo designis TaxID=312471 RepID=A0A7S1MTR3_NEODS|mmetsp:Transcript_46379/g.143131  ORF Transcript_46379/g.143131 Transcript_46379/m.143131 type:complete len:455 (+) Transcript_46379:59-1423(+)|eukprot:CAMPEP_0174853110 /NCGR_PEP_ID=MMETSP1114-20130205/27361_1 /TAXON_ID=312471 /ORGANISM="Neobodo designis, Strain CCAP 1951/1" /LENGTH=454 /DNA_ID=CAMNT_0016087731 /DNA_START=59 /DNA_END=1423 /DNA_ORIENTATION=+